LKTTLFWVITQPVFPNFKGQGFLTVEDGTDRLSRNVGKELHLLAAW